MPPCRTHRATYEKFEDGKSKDISDELPFDLPQGWAWARLKRVGAISTGPFGSNLHQSDYVSDGTPIVNPINMVDGKIIPDKYISQETQKRLSEYTLHPGMIVLGRRGEMGRCAIVSEHQDGWLCGTGSFFIRLHGEIDSFYVRLLFTSQYARAIFEGDSKGTTMFNLSQGTLSHLLFPVPPLVEQKRIVAKVEEFFAYADEIGEASESVAKTAQRIDKKILDLAIRGQLVPQDQSDEPASELLKRIEAAKRAKAGGRVSSRAASDRPAYEIDPPFDIPDSWKWVKFGTLIQVIAGVSYQKDDVTTSGVRILRGGNIKEDARIYLHDDDVFLPAAYAEDITSVKAGDIVVVASTGSSTVIGRPAVATETLLGVQIGAFLRIVRAIDDSIMSWLPVIFLGDYYRNFIRSKSKGTNIKNLKTEYLTELPVPLPPLAEQKRIVTKIKELRAMTKSLTM